MGAATDALIDWYAGEDSGQEWSVEFDYDRDTVGSVQDGSRVGISRGLIPAQRRMKLRRTLTIFHQGSHGHGNLSVPTSKVICTPTDDFLIAQYNPELISEKDSVEFVQNAIGPVGAMMRRVQFRWGKPRTWQFTLTFSRWADDINPYELDTPKGLMTPQKSIEWLQHTQRPQVGLNARTVSIGEKPSPVLVTIFEKTFAAYITDINIRYTKLHPMNGETVRADVDLDFTEFFPSEI